MAKIIEAKAIITGEEKLSPLLDKLAKKFDQVQKSAKTSGDVDKMAASLQKVNQQLTAIEKFNASRLGLSKTLQDYRKAQEQVEAAAKAMRLGQGDPKKLEAEFKGALRAVQAASRAYEQQRSAISGAKRALDSEGVSIARVAERQAQLTSAIHSANAALDKQNAAMHRNQRAAREHAGFMHGSAGQFLATGAAGYVSAHAVAHGVADSVKAGARVQHERTALVNAGRTPTEMAAIEAAAQQTIRNVPTATIEESLKTVNETTGAFGSVEHAIENLPFMMKAASVLHAAAGDKVHEGAGEMGNKFARFFEMRGTAIHSEKFREEAGEMVRSMAFTRGNFNPSEMLLFGQQATPGTLMNYDMRFLSRIAPSLVTEFGGDRAGTAANAFRNVLMGKARDKKQTEMWIKAGLLDPNQTIKGNNGQAIGWKAGAVKDTDLALHDPLRWMEEVELPALRKMGIDTENSLSLTKAHGQMFRNSMSNRFAEALGQANSRLRLHKDEANINRTGTMPEMYARNLAQDPTVAMTALTSSLDNLVSVATSPAMLAAAGAITGIAKALNGVAMFGKDHPNIAMGAGAGAALGGMAGAGWLTYKIFNGFGLGASAVALDGSAAALTAAAGALTAAAGGNAAGGAIAGAGAAATAGGAGITMGSTLLSGGPVAAAIFGLDFMKRDAASGNSMRSWLRERLGIPDPGEPAPWQVGGSFGRTLGINAYDGGKAFDSKNAVQAELHGEAEVKGTGELTVKFEAGTELLRIVDQAKKASMNLSGVVRANGPGSLGVSSPDAAPSHPSGVGHN